MNESKIATDDDRSTGARKQKIKIKASNPGGFHIKARLTAKKNNKVGQGKFPNPPLGMGAKIEIWQRLNQMKYQRYCASS